LLLVAGLGIFTLGTSSYFSWLQIQKVQKITIGDDYIETMFGKLNFDEIAKISMDRRIISPFGEVTDTNNIELYLILEPIDKSKQLTVLSEKIFDIKSIKVALEEKIDVWKE
jgi:hypothetical protein